MDMHSQGTRPSSGEPRRRGDDSSARLLTVAELIPHSDTVVDVGSDHGKLGVWCLRKAVCKNVIATDIHVLPARRSEERFEREGLSDRAHVRVTDGLSGVALREDMTVAIAGMGGLEICKILDHAMREGEGMPKGIHLVLQPQRSFFEVRTFLSETGYRILDEKIAKERGHFYVVILAEYTGEPYSLTDTERFLGPCILSGRPEFYDEYMAHEKTVMGKRALGDPRCAEILGNWENW